MEATGLKAQEETTNVQQLNMLSNKEIFRILAFEYRQPEGIKIEIIAKLVSTVFYPFAEAVKLREGFERDILHAFQPYADNHGRLTEEKFCEVMVGCELHSPKLINT